MAMVQIHESEVTSRSNTEDGSQTSDHSETSSRPSSRSSTKSRSSTPRLLPQHQYSREELIKISKLKHSRQRPDFLDPAHYNSTGRWDPERWFVNKRGDKPLLLEETPRPKRERQEGDVGISHKRRPSDPKERIKEEKGDIVLSPQRRSFGTGCHVIQQSALARRPGSPTDGRSDENFRETRRIGSGRIMSRDREQRDWERDRDYGYGSSRNDRRDRFDADDGDKEIRRYTNRYGRGDRRMSRGHDRIEEEEPEWFSGGPTSQSETIELVGFDDQPNEDDRKRPGKKSKKSKDSSRRQSLMSDGDKSESSSSRLASPFHEEALAAKESQPVSEHVKSLESSKPDSPELKQSFEAGDSKDNNFDLDQLLRMDLMPELLPETSQDTTNSEIGVSRFSQWFKRESPVLCVHGSGDSSRRSSIQDDIIAHVLGLNDPHLIPSPPPITDNLFAPISPALSQSPNYTIPPPHPVSCSGNKNILEILQAGNMGNSNSVVNGEILKINGTDALEKAKTVKELEAGLKRMVLGNKADDDRSAFDKLVQHMTEANSSPSPASISIGPIDKSKALQEEDLLQNILGQGQSPSQNCHSQVYEDKSSIVSEHVSGSVHPPFLQQQQPPQNDVFAQLLQRQRHQEQHVQAQQRQLQQAQHQMQMQKQQSQPGLNVQGLTVDMLALMLGNQQSQAHLSPLSPNCQQSGSQFFGNRNEPQTLNAIMRQRDIISMFKQQQPAAAPPAPQVLTPSPVVQHRNQPAKDISTNTVPQTLGLPLMGTGLSPRNSPLPPDAMGSTIAGQGRIPSPLVFGQQPPALSHAPAPIHPAHLAQAIAQNAATSSNTLQVQNALVLQRVPSPQELAVHTQSILQNALIKRKLEEQKENFRKRQEAQRTNSPGVSSSKNGIVGSPQKGISPIAFTPTSVMKKMHSEKTDNQQKNETQNGSLQMSEGTESQGVELSQLKPSSTAVSTTVTENIFGNTTSNGDSSMHSSGGPRAVHGQGLTNQARLQQGMINVTHQGIPSQGRPIVKGNVQINLSGGIDGIRQTASATKGVTPNKFVIPNNPQSHTLHSEVGTGMDTFSKLAVEKQRLLQQQAAALAAQRKLNTSPMAPLPTPTFTLGPRGPTLAASHHPGLVRPVNIGPAAVGAQNINYPLLRMMQANPAVRAAQTLNPLSHLGQLAALQQFQRGSGDSRQMQALAQNRNLHPLALQQLLQNQVAVAQAQVAAGLAGVRGDGKHQHLVPGQPATSRQSPVNLAKWFGSDVLKQKMPDMPAATHQKALLVEEVERQQQQSTTVHN